MAERGPVIGITASELTATYGDWTERCTLVPTDYVRAVARAGGIPVVLAAVDGAARSVADHLDGLVLTGGTDVDPDVFGAPRHPQAQRPDRRRDRFELDLLDAAADGGLPVLAICRGIQVVNVWRGGTLHQHLPDVGASPEHLGPPGGYGTHRVRLDPASRLGALLGAELDVPTHHHQGIDRLGSGRLPWPAGTPALRWPDPRATPESWSRSTHDRGPRLDQALRQDPGGRLALLRGPAGTGDRFPRAQRVGEVDHHADDHGPRPA